MMDPRPDLIDDTMLWDLLLSSTMILALRALLTGLRCEGALLAWNEKGRLKLDWRAAARRTVQGERAIEARLVALREPMTELFARVEVGE